VAIEKMLPDPNIDLGRIPDIRDRPGTLRSFALSCVCHLPCETLGDYRR
jgi:hypothetical protein